MENRSRGPGTPNPLKAHLRNRPLLAYAGGARTSAHSAIEPPGRRGARGRFGWSEIDRDGRRARGLVAGLVYLKTDWRASQAIQSMGKAARARRFAIVPREEGEAAESGLRQPSDDAAEKKTLDAVDRVLDKISAEGMASLTEQERELLDQVSKKHRTN